MAAIPRANGAYVSALRTEDMLADLYNGLADQYIKEHENEYKDDAEKAAAREQFLKDNQNIIEAVSRSSDRIVNTNWDMVYSALPKKSNAPKVEERTKAAYADIVGIGFTNKLLDALRVDPLKLRKSQTGIELMEGVTARAHVVSFTPTRKFGIFGNIQSEKEAFQNILDRGGKFIEYDLEGIEDFITQYAFAEVDKNMKGPLKTSSQKMVTGLVGLTAKGESEILALVDKYDKEGMRGTGWKGLEEKYSYVMDELLKFGMSDWHIDKDTGRAVLDAYASDADIRNLDLDPKQRMATIRQGVTKLRDINKALTKDTVTFMGEKVYAYERDILQQIAFAKKGKDGALTMVSTNGLAYDADKIENMFGMNGWASEGGKHIFQRLTGKTGSIQSATHQLDMTSIGRALASANMPLQYREAAAEAARRGETFNTSTGNSLVYLGKDGMAQVEAAVAQELGGTAVKHAANADVFMQASTHAAMIDRWVGIDKKYIERMFSQTTGPYEGREDASIFGRANKEIHAERGSVFHIRNGQFGQRGYGLSFVQDAISGEQRFAGNVRVDQKGLARADIVSQGVKKGATAVMLSDMVEVHIDPNSAEGKALYEKFRRAGINPHGENLYAVRYGLVGELGYAKNEYVQIGTRDQLMRMFQDNDFIGKFDIEKYKQGAQKAANREAKRVAESNVTLSALAKNRNDILAAHKAGLIPDYVADAVKRFDYWTTSVKVELLKEKSAHYAAYEKQKAALTKKLGKTEKAVDYLIDQAFNMTSYGMNDEELYRAYREARKQTARANEKRKASKEPRDEALEKLNTVYDERSGLWKQKKDLEKQMNQLYAKMEELKPEEGWYFEGGDNNTKEYEEYSKLEDQLYDLKDQHEDIKIAYQDADGRFKKAHKEYAKWNKQYQMFREKYEDKLGVRDILGSADQEMRDNVRQAIETKYRELAPLFQLEDEHRAWLKDYNERLQNGGRIQPATNAVVQPNIQNPTFSSMDIDKAMLSVENAWAIDTSEVSHDVAHALGMKGEDGKYRLDVGKLEKRSAAVIQEETAGNWLRTMDYKKANRAVSLLHAFTDFNAEFFGMHGSVVTAAQRDRTMRYIIESYQHGENSDIVKGMDGDQLKAYRKLTDAVHDVMFDKDGNPERDLYPNTLRNFGQTYRWLNEMNPVLTKVLDAANRLGDSDHTKAAYFDELYQNVLAGITQQANQEYLKIEPTGRKRFTMDDAIGRSPFNLEMTREERNSFEVDLNDIMAPGKTRRLDSLDAKEKNLFKINLEEPDSFGRRLANAMGLRHTDRQPTVMNALHLFANSIYEQYSGLDEKLEKKLRPLKGTTEQTFAEATIQREIVLGLKAIREFQPEAGLPNAVRLMDIYHAPKPVQIMKKHLGNDFGKGIDDIIQTIEKDPSFTRFEEQGSAEDVAKKLTNALFKHTQEVTETKLKKYGYSDDRIKDILKQREQRKWETEAFMTDLFKGTYQDNKYIGYGYSDDGRLVFRTSTNEEVDVTHLLPFDRFDEKTGQFYTAIGGRSIASKQILSETAGSNGSGLAVHSLINEYTKALREKINYAMSSKRSDVENIGNIDHFMTEALNSISDRAFTKFDDADAREGEFLDLSNFFKCLGMYQEKGAYATVQLNERTKELLDKLMHSYLGKNPDPEHNPINPEVDTLSASQWSTIYRDIDRLLAPLADRSSKLSQLVFDNDEDWERFQKILKHGTVSGIRHPENGYIAVSSENMPFLAGFGEDKRYVNQVVMRSKELDDKAVEEMRRIIGRKGSGESTVDSITRIGSVIRTAEEAERERNGIYREKVFRTAHLSMTQSELEKVMSSKFAQDEMKKLGMSAQEFFTYIGESGSISNPEYLKLFRKNIQQRERTNSLVDLTTVRNRAGDEATARENEIRTRTQDRLVVDDKGVHFSYSNDDAVLIKKGDVYAWEKSYTGNPDKQIADRTGFITRRYYDRNGDRISASEIEQVLSRPENAARLQSIQNASASGDNKQLRRVADEILNNAGYQQRYEIESVDYKPYRKILVNMEKSMSKFLMPSLGQVGGSKVGAALGNVAKEKIEAALPAFLSPTVLNSMSRTNAILKDAGLQEFTSKDQWESFRNAIREDNQRTWNTFAGIFKHEGYLAPGQQLGIVSTLENEAAKPGHSELGGRVTGAINEAVEYLARAKARGGASSDKNYADASAEIRDALIKNKIFTDADGNNVVKAGREGLGNEAIEIGRASIFDENKFNSIMTAYHPDYASKKTENGEYAYQTLPGMQRAEVIVGRDEKGRASGLASVRIQGQTIDGVYRYDKGERVAKLGVGQVRAVDDADEGRLNSGGKGGVKLTRRFFAAADQDLVEMTGLLKEAHALDRMEQASAGSGFSAEDEFNRMYRGIATAKRGEDGKLHVNMEAMEDGQHVRRVNNPIIQNMKEELVAGTDAHRQYGVSEAGNKRFFETLEREGISKETAQGIFDTYKSRGFSLIGADFVKNNFAYASGLAAMNFNKEIQAAETEEQKQAVIKKYTGEHGLLGQNVINIKDADFSTQGNANNLNNLTERAGIVQIGDQYVAIGYQPSSMMDNEKGTGTASRTKLRDTMSKIQSQADHVIEANYKNTTSEFGNVDASIEEARNEVVRSVSSKEGAAAAATTGYLDHSAMFKGGIIRTNNGEVVSNGYHADLKTHINENPLLREAKVGGKSILEHEAAGNHINAVFVGKDYFENLVRGSSFQQGLAAVKGYDSVKQVTEQDTQEALEAVLKQARSNGGIGIALRQPMEYLGSVQGVHVYYGEGIASNEMLLTESAATAMKLDKDGDQGYMNAIREQVNITNKDGKAIVTNARMSQIEAQGLQAVAGGSLNVSFKNDGSIFSQIEGAAGISANSTQSNYVGSDYDRKTGTKKSAEEGINGAQEHPEVRIEGRLYNLAGQEVGFDKRADIKNNYRDLITNNEHFQAFAKQQGIEIDQKNPETFTAMEFAKSGKADKFVSYMRENVGGNEAEQVARTIGNAAAVESIGEEESKMVMRTDAGLANMETYRMKRLVSNLEARGETNFQAGDANIIGHFAEHLNDAFQASKNSTATGSFTPESFGNALRDFFGVNRGRVRRTQPLMDMIQQMHDDKVKELFNVPVQEGIEHAPNEMISAERVQQAFMNILPENRVITQDAYEQARVGYTDKKGIEPKYAESNAADIKSDLDAAANEQLHKAGLDDIKLIDGPLTAEARSIMHQQDDTLDKAFDESKVINAAEESMDIEEAVKGTFKTIGHALNHGGAKAMLGFAGAMMMAGMAGGAPTSPTPAQGQAKGIQSENAMYSIPSTMPSAGGNSQPQSYVINVNASTDRGRDFATQVINQAMSRFPQTSGGNRMTMNINDSSSSIGMGDISGYISSML